LQPYSKKKAVIPQIEEDQIVLYAAVEGKDIEGFCEDGSFKHIFPKSGKLSIELYKPPQPRQCRQLNYYLNNPTKEYFFKVRLIGFSTEIMSYACAAKQN
jgi:hypothetical protein